MTKNIELLNAFVKYDKGEKVDFLKDPIKADFGIKDELLEILLDELEIFYNNIIKWNEKNQNFVKNENLLKSALSNLPYATDSIYFICDLSISIMKNHPFNDGNKRSGFVALISLCDVNDVIFNDQDKEIIWSNYVNIVKEDVDYNKSDFKEWFRQFSQKSYNKQKEEKIYNLLSNDNSEELVFQIAKTWNQANIYMDINKIKFDISNSKEFVEFKKFNWFYNYK